jgi:hypothetical protein
MSRAPRAAIVFALLPVGASTLSLLILLRRSLDFLSLPSRRRPSGDGSALIEPDPSIRHVHSHHALRSTSQSPKEDQQLSASHSSASRVASLVVLFARPVVALALSACAAARLELVDYSRKDALFISDVGVCATAVGFVSLSRYLPSLADLYDTYRHSWRSFL